jgi:hypothetical protein
MEGEMRGGLKELLNLKVEDCIHRKNEFER